MSKAASKSTLPSEAEREQATDFENADMFSEYYLRQGLWSGKRSKELFDPDAAKEAWRSAKRAFDVGTFALDEFASEAETRKRWVRPLLKALGIELAGGVEIETDKGLLATNHHHPFSADDGEEKTRLLVQIEAWGTDLDAAREGLTGRATPTNQALRCLRHADSNSRWAIVTNGQALRLLGSDLKLPPRAFLEFDLVAMLRDGSPDDAGWLLLHALLREETLRPDEDGTSRLDRVLDESRQLAASVKGSLGDVIPKLLETLVRDLRRANPEFRDEADADEAFRTGVVLLYRLLFIAYAESEGLLPTGNHIYRRSYSLEVLRDEVDKAQRDGRAWSPGRYTLWPQLATLFRFLRDDHSTPDLPLMPLGGGLFDPTETPWLEKVRLPDPAAAHLIDGLSMADIRVGRSRKATSRERINYADLDISELGSIYESLLEYKPAIATEPMAIVTTKKGDQTLPERFAGEHDRRTDENDEPVVIPEGEFYLATWNGLRKGSGTYYTPREFTEFQVKNTLEPLSQTAVEEGRPEDILDLAVCDPAMGSGAFLVAAVQYLGERLLDACVEASTQARYQESTQRLRGEGDAPPTHGPAVCSALSEVIERARKHTLDRHDLRTLERLAAEHCIYGVDINPMAVQLARVSLWLATASKDRALTFLDDRLVCGDSLIGARLDDLHPGRVPKPIADATLKDLRGNKRKAAQKALKMVTFREFQGFEEPLAALAKERAAIADQPTVTVHDAAWKAQALTKLRDDPISIHQRLGKLGHLWAALWFWDDLSAAEHIQDAPFPDRGQWERIGKFLVQGGGDLDKDEEAIVAAATRLGEARHYLCWTLAFPEVFVEREGFDAVVGNPPWEATRVTKKEWYSRFDPGINDLTGTQFDQWLERTHHRHPDVAAEANAFFSAQDAMKEFYASCVHFPIPSGRDVNTYKFFLQRAHDLARHGGLIAEIIPSGLGSGGDAGPLRVHYIETTRFRYWIDFENSQGIFPIHRSTRFVLFLTKKGDVTDVLHCCFYERELEALRRYPEEGLLEVPRSLIEKLSGDDLAFTEFREQAEIGPLKAMYEAAPRLGDRLDGTWNVMYRQEFNTTLARKLFNTEGRGLPLLKGESFYPFDAGPYSHDYWVDEEKGREALRKKIENSRDKEFIEASLGQGVLPCDAPRVVFRGVASSTNYRTGIFACLPPGCFLAHSIGQLFVAPRSRQVDYFLTGMLGSLPADFALRRKVAANVTKNFLYVIPIPRNLETPHAKALARISARLHAFWGARPAVDPEHVHKLAPCVPTALEAALNAHAFHMYRMSRADMEFVLQTFPQVDVALRDATVRSYDAIAAGEDPERAAWEAVIKHQSRGHEDPGDPPWETMPWQGWSDE